jgi:hypothetical protein
MIIAGNTFMVVQDGGTSADCQITAAPSRRTFGSSGGEGVISIGAGPRCSWQATSNASWVSFTTASAGVGNHSLSFAVAANSEAGRRKATVTVSGASFTIKQKGN